MKRYVDLSEISDGNLYRANDLVKADCAGCIGCSSCCQNMGQSIVLDPCDIHRLTTGLSLPFEILLENKIELNVFDGMILPNLKMQGKDEACAFLNEEGRCAVHSLRPGICRLFPLGRYYENGSFSYFLQIHECKKESRTKVKVKQWIDTPDLKQYEAYIQKWHDFVCGVQNRMMERSDEELFKKVNLFLLHHFFIEPYKKEDFYGQFEERLLRGKEYVKRVC